MSTLVCETITNGSQSISVDNSIKGTAKAWFLYQGGTANGVVASIGFSAVTEVSTGIFDCTLTTARPNNFYVVLTSLELDNNGLYGEAKQVNVSFGSYGNQDFQLTANYTTPSGGGTFTPQRIMCAVYDNF